MDERDLANLIYEYGEERRSRRIARAIVRARPVTTTGQLARIVAGSAPTMKSERIHPATRTFQALRIHVNRELDEIRQLLEAAPKLLKPASGSHQARIVVISFHSLEDRIAKDVLREVSAKGIWTVLTRKPVVAEEAETDRNPRARSAKLRAAEMNGPDGAGSKERAEYQDPGSVRQLTGFAQLATKKAGKKRIAQRPGKKPRLRK
jgi:16S rRNA (cytosine1402-N4)-methyltransferase